MWNMAILTIEPIICHRTKRFGSRSSSVKHGPYLCALQSTSINGGYLRQYPQQKKSPKWPFFLSKTKKVKFHFLSSTSNYIISQMFFWIFIGYYLWSIRGQTHIHVHVDDVVNILFKFVSIFIFKTKRFYIQWHFSVTLYASCLFLPPFFIICNLLNN